MTAKHRPQPKQARFVLGTVQLGLAYGAANRTGMPSEADAIEIVRTAISRGVHEIDTARAYGDSERRIGMALASIGAPVVVMTKLAPIAAAPEDMEGAIQVARESLSMSRRALRSEHLAVVQLHRADNRTQWHGAVWDFLRSEQSAGMIGRLGVSVQSPEEAFRALEDAGVEHIQLPFNMFDYRWADAGVIAALRQRPEVMVHARSVLLQGLLTATAGTHWPQISGISPDEINTRLRKVAMNFHRDSVADLAIAYVRAQDWLDGIVIGVETQEQLNANLDAFERPALSSDARDVIERLPRLSEMLFDPARWDAAT
jgi:spore coat polysaccharide biosynthesis protein SpsF